MLTKIIHFQFRIVFVSIISVLLVSCTEKRETMSGLKKDSNKISDKNSTAGVKEGDNEFRV